MSLKQAIIKLYELRNSTFSMYSIHKGKGYYSFNLSTLEVKHCFFKSFHPGIIKPKNKIFILMTHQN